MLAQINHVTPMFFHRFKGIRTALTAASIALLITILLPACIGPQRVNNWIDKKYKHALTAPTKNSTDYITVSTSLVTGDPKNSSTAYAMKIELPLILYWQWSVTNTCTLNPQLPFNNFANTAIANAAVKGLANKLNGRRVELVLTKIPNVFTLDDKGHLVFLGIGYFGWDVISVIPANNNLVVSYKIMQESTELKQGVISIPDLNKPITLKLFNSPKRKIWQYIDRYNENITAMSKEVIDRLINEL